MGKAGGKAGKALEHMKNINDIFHENGSGHSIWTRDHWSIDQMTMTREESV